MFIYFFIFILCLFHLSKPDVVCGQSFARQVFEEYKGLLLREDIYPGIQAVLQIVKKPEIQKALDPTFIDVYLSNPAFFRDLDPDFSPQFIGLLSVDDKLRAFFRDKKFYNILKNSAEIDELLRLIEKELSRPTTLEIVSGKNQQNKPNTRLSMPFIVVVKDQFDTPLDDIDVIFEITEGDGTLSVKDAKTQDGGQAETTLTLGPNEGIIQVEARVDVNNPSLTQTFTAAAVLAGPTVYITLETEETRFSVGAEFTLNLNIANAKNASKFKATVQFDPTVLEFVEAVGKDHSEKSISCVLDTLDNAKVVVIEGQSDGDGILAKLTFKIRASKTLNLTLSEVILYDNEGKELPTPYVKNKFVVPSPPAVYAINLEGVGDLTTETTDASAGVSYTLKVTNTGNTDDTVVLGSSAEVGIEGSVLRSFSQSDDQVPMSQLEIALAAGASAEVIFTAAGDSFTKPGKYEIKVTATSQGDKTKTAEITTLTTIEPVPWDINADGTINISDLVQVANQLGESGKGLASDVNMDGEVNVLDLVQVASYFGKTQAEIVQGNLQQI